MNEHPNAEVAEDGPAVGESPELTCLVALASQAWRLSRVTKRALDKLPDADAARIASQDRYLDRQMADELHRVGISVVDLEGQGFDPGTAATALNAEDFQVEDSLCVAQMIEPVIMGRAGLLKYGVVMLGKVES